MDHFKRTMLPLVALSAMAAGMASSSLKGYELSKAAAGINMGRNERQGGHGTKAHQRAALKRRNRARARRAAR